MNGLGDLLSAFQTKQSRLAQGQGTPQTPPATSRGHTPVSRFTDDGNSANMSPFDGPLSSGTRESEMDLDGDEEAGNTRLSSLMGTHTRALHALSGRRAFTPDLDPGEHEADSGFSLNDHSRSQYQSYVQEKVRKYALSSSQYDELMAFCEVR